MELEILGSSGSGGGTSREIGSVVENIGIVGAEGKKAGLRYRSVQLLMAGGGVKAQRRWSARLSWTGQPRMED